MAPQRRARLTARTHCVPVYFAVTKETVFTLETFRNFDIALCVRFRVRTFRDAHV